MSEIVLYITGWLATGSGFIFLIYGLYVICRWAIARMTKPSRVSGSSQAPKRRRGKKFRRFITGCTTLSSVVLFSLLYISLAVIGIKRATTTKAAGPALEQDQWTFGQVMAMATWVPTFLDFVLVVRGEWLLSRYPVKRYALTQLRLQEVSRLWNTAFRSVLASGSSSKRRIRRRAKASLWWRWRKQTMARDINLSFKRQRLQMCQGEWQNGNLYCSMIIRSRDMMLKIGAHLS